MGAAFFVGTAGAAHAQATSYELVPGEETSVPFGTVLELLELLPGTNTTYGVGAANQGPWSNAADLTGDGRLTCRVQNNDLVFAAGSGAPVNDTCFARVCTLPLGLNLPICRVQAFTLSLVTCKAGDTGFDPGCTAEAPACDIDGGTRTCVGCTDDSHCGAPDDLVPVLVGEVTTITSPVLHRLLGLGLLAPLSDIKVRADVNEPYGDEAVIGTDLTCAVVDGDIVVDAGPNANGSGTCFVQACLLDTTCIEIPLDVLVDLCLTGGTCTPFAQCDVPTGTCVACTDDAEPGALDSGCNSSTPSCNTSGESAVCAECTEDLDCEPGLLTALLGPSGEVLVGLEDILEFLRLAPTLIPSDVQVSSTSDGIFSDEALAQTDVNVANCAVTADGDVAVTAIAASGVAKCYVEVCADLIGGTVETCVVAPIEVKVDACVLSGTCHIEPTCLANGTCGECRDTTDAGQIDRGCSDTTPACLDASCVECIEDADCAPKFPLVDLDLGEEAVIGRDVILAALNLDDVLVNLSNLQVGSEIDGEFSDTALLDIGADTAQCTVDPDGDVTVLASSDVYAEVICYVRACVTVAGVDTCLVAPITLNVDPCKARGDCRPPICGGNNTCQECRDDGPGMTDTGCGDVNPACLMDAAGIDDSVCVECTDDSDCDTGLCDGTTNTCVTCTDLGDGVLDEGCDTVTPACLVTDDPSTDRCVDCTADPDCAGDTVCDTDVNVCVACRDDAADGVTDTGCNETTPICTDTPENPTCVACVDDTVGAVDTGCATDLPACLEGEDASVCHECTVNADCAMDFVCDQTSYTCVAGPPNSAPETIDATVTTAEDTAALIPLADFIMDPEGDAFAIDSISVDPFWGVATVVDATTVLYTPLPNYNGNDLFAYQVCDNRGACSEGLVRMFVTPVNDAPLAFDDILELEVDTMGSADVLDNDIDPDGDELAVGAFMSMSSDIAAQLDENGFIQVTPVAGFVGTATVNYEACDPDGLCEQGVLTVYVGVDGPGRVIAVDDLATTEAAMPVDIDVLANDTAPDGLTLAVAGFEQATHGLVVATADGKLRYIPFTSDTRPLRRDAEGDDPTADSFRYTACTPDGRCDGATVSIDITGELVNRAPVAIDDIVFTRIDSEVTFDPTFNDFDIDGDVISLVSFTQPTNGVITQGEGNSLTYTPAAGFEGIDEAQVTVKDEEGLESSSRAIFVVNNSLNTAPMAVDDNFVVENGVATSLDVLANDSDADGDTLTITGITQPQMGTALITTDDAGNQFITVTANSVLDELQSFTYTISDGRGGTATGRVTISVTPNGDGVFARDDALTTNEDTAGAVNVLANDGAAPGQTLTVTRLTEAPAHGAAIVGEDGVIMYTPNADYFGSDRFTYEACDGTDTCDTASVVVSVTAVNDAPVAMDDMVTVTTGSTTTLNVLANDVDVDGDTLTIQTLNATNDNGTLTRMADGSALTFVAPADWIGTTTATYEACDTSGLCGEATVTIEVVADEVDGPVATDDSVTTPMNVMITIMPLANDVSPGNVTLAIESFDQPEFGDVSQQGANLKFVPVQDWTGVARFDYVVCDAVARCDSATVTVIVTPTEVPNRAPIAVNDAFVIDAGAGAELDVVANDTDPDGDVLTLTSATGATQGVVTVTDGGKVFYTPTNLGEFEDVFTYEVCDADGLCDEGVARVTTKKPTVDRPLMVKGGPNCGAGDSPAWPALFLLVGAWLVLRRRQGSRAN